MSVDLGVRMNAMGYGPQDLRSPEGGNNGRGMLDQVWPTGIMATGGRKREAGRKAERKGMRSSRRK